MSGISFNTQKEDSASLEGKLTEYNVISTSEKLTASNVIAEQGKPRLVRAAFRGEKLESYTLMTQPYATEEIVEPQQQIVDILDKILPLLESLKEDFSNPIETESVFANIMQYHKNLWKLRRERELSFSDILVSLESAIKYYDTTELTLDKINILVDIFESLKGACLRSDFPQLARKSLRRVGFDLTRPAVGIPEKFSEVLKKLKQDE